MGKILCQRGCQRPLGSRASPYCCSWTQLVSFLWRESGSSCAFLISCWSIGDHSVILWAPRKAGVAVMRTLWFLFLACTSGCGWYAWGQNWERRNGKLHWIILLFCFQMYGETDCLLLSYFAAEVTSLKHKYLYFWPWRKQFFL